MAGLMKKHRFQAGWYWQLGFQLARLIAGANQKELARRQRPAEACCLEANSRPRDIIC